MSVDQNKKMIKSKRLKKKQDSQDEFNIDDIVDSQGQEHSQRNIHEKVRQNSPSSQKISSQSNKNEKIQQKIVPTGQKLTIEQIKQYIETQIPQMKQQIEEMDDQSLREIYQSVNQSNLNEESQQQKQVDTIQNFQQQTKNNENQDDFTDKSKKRDPQIQFMLDQIIKNVPHMKDQVQIFDDKQIQQLYQTVSSCQNNQSQLEKDTHSSRNSNSGMKIEEIKKFLSQKIPSMKNQLNYLSNQDILEVYQKYAQKDKPPSLNKPNNYQSHQGYPNQYNANHFKTPMKNTYQPYDSFKNYPNNIKSGVKLEPRLNYDSDQQRYYGQFNNYKYGSGNQKLHSSHLDTNNHYNPNYNTEFANNLQVHAFHNNQRVSNFPYNHQKYAKTVVIFHTMDPGYIPPPKSNCRCPCCSKRQNGMQDENPLNSFIFEMMKKYSSKK